MHRQYRNSGLRPFNCSACIKISTADRSESLALAIESIRQRMQQLRLRRVGPQHSIESTAHCYPYRDAGERIGDGPAKVLRVEDTEVKRVQKCDHHIEPCANESLFFESVRYQLRSRP